MMRDDGGGEKVFGELAENFGKSMSFRRDGRKLNEGVCVIDWLLS